MTEIKDRKCSAPFCKENRSGLTGTYCKFHNTQYQELRRKRLQRLSLMVSDEPKSVNPVVNDNFKPRTFDDIDEDWGTLPIEWSEAQWEYWGTRWASKNWRFKHLK